MAKIRFPKSNNIRFINVKNYSQLENDETRLYYDFVYQSITNDNYFQKIQQSHGIWFQFRTDYDSINAYIVKSDGTETDISSYIVSGATISNGTNQYQLTHPLTGITGIYYIRVDFNQDYDKPEAIYQSEWFEVSTSFDYCSVVEYMNGSNPTSNDGMIWNGETQKLIIESRIMEAQYGSNSSLFETETHKQITTESHPIKRKIWEIELIPDYLIEIINIALRKEYFYINKVRYNTDSDLDVSQIKDTRFYSGTLELRVVEDFLGVAYEDYTDDAELTGDAPVPTPGNLLISDTDSLLIATDKLKLN